MRTYSYKVYPIGKLFFLPKFHIYKQILPKFNFHLPSSAFHRHWHIVGDVGSRITLKLYTYYVSKF